jgi:hypothetical protein
MNRWDHEQEEEITRALDKAMGSVNHQGAGRWDFPLRNGGLRQGGADRDGEWLALRASLNGEAAGASPWDLLRWNAVLAGPAKLVRGDGQGPTGLRAEMPLEGSDLGTRLAAACRGFQQALDLLEFTAPEPVGPPGEAQGRELARLCADAGWPYREKDGGAVSVDLEVPEACYRARLEEGCTGEVDITASLIRGVELSAPSRDAMGELLLAAGGSVRMARPSAREAGDGAEVLFEVRLTGEPAPIEVHHALAALSVACGLCGQEVDALRDRRLAERYLEVRGLARAPVSGPARCRT